LWAQFQYQYPFVHFCPLFQGYEQINPEQKKKKKKELGRGKRVGFANIEKQFQRLKEQLDKMS